MEENKKRFKYVRTTHGVFEISKEYGDCVMCGTEQEFKNLCEKNFDCYYTDTIKQAIYSRRNGIGIMLPYTKSADAIEELCDWYVTVWSKDGHTEYCTYYDLDRDLFQSLIRAKFTVYGAIWTDKGLIYVAKMNEKGEFELL